MSELRHILAAAVFATVAAVVADDQADRSATPAPAKADHSLPGLAVAARADPVSADSGRPAGPAAATAAAADLEMTLELREPRRERPAPARRAPFPKLRHCAQAPPKARPQPWPGPSTHSWAPRTDPGPSSWRPTLRAAGKQSLSLWPSLVDGHSRPPGLPALR